MIYLYTFAAFLAGALIGLGAGRRIERRRDAAPVPEQLADLTQTGPRGPLNASHGEPVEICGVMMWRV